MADLELRHFGSFVIIRGCTPLKHPYDGDTALPLPNWNAKSNTPHSAKCTPLDGHSALSLCASGVLGQSHLA